MCLATDVAENFLESIDEAGIDVVWAAGAWERSQLHQCVVI